MNIKINVNPDGIIKNKNEMEEVLRRYRRDQWACTWAGGGILILIIGFLFIGDVFIDKNFSTWIEILFKKYILIVVIIVVILTFLFQKSKFYLNNFESLRIPVNNVAIPYQKAEADILNGIHQENIKLVVRGVEHLEDLNEYLSEMSEYHELLDKGQNWLKTIKRSM